MAKGSEAVEPAVTEPGTSTFPVAQLLTSKQFAGIEKDVLRGVLDPDRTYTLDEARAAIKAYAESEVQ